MRTTAPWRRLTGLVGLLLHLMVAGLVPLADARLEAQSRLGDVSHVESERDHGCAPGHDHAACQLCHVGQTRSLAAAAGPLPDYATTRRAATRPRSADLAPSAAPVSSLGARAPPLA